MQTRRGGRRQRKNLQRIVDFTSNKEENNCVCTDDNEPWKEKSKEDWKPGVHVAAVKEEERRGREKKY
jgi:hypothetical protein